MQALFFKALLCVFSICYILKHWNRGGFYGLADLLSLGSIRGATGACIGGGLRGGSISKAGR
jgi:hypothetical protein